MTNNPYAPELDPFFSRIQPLFATEDWLVQEYGSIEKFQQPDPDLVRTFQVMGEHMITAAKEIIPLVVLLSKDPGQLSYGVNQIDVTHLMRDNVTMQMVPLYLRHMLQTSPVLRARFTKGEKIISTHFFSETWISRVVVGEDVDVSKEVIMPTRPRNDPQKRDCVVVMGDYFNGAKNLYYEKMPDGTLKYEGDAQANIPGVNNIHLATGYGNLLYGLFRKTAGLPVEAQWAKVTFADEGNK